MESGQTPEPGTPRQEYEPPAVQDLSAEDGEAVTAPGVGGGTVLGAEWRP